MDKLYVVKYSGLFGFIKPWTAVRDSETFSQQFLTPSIIEGIERKLFPELLNEQGIKAIKRHRLSYTQIAQQQEVIQTRGWNLSNKIYSRPTSIIVRGLMVDPVLYLAFEDEEYAKRAMTQHLCLVRNEDVMLPEEMLEIMVEDFDDDNVFPGFELMFEKTDESFHVGYNRTTNEPMYGWLKIVGVPVADSVK